MNRYKELREEANKIADEQNLEVSELTDEEIEHTLKRLRETGMPQRWDPRTIVVGMMMKHMGEKLVSFDRMPGGPLYIA